MLLHTALDGPGVRVRSFAPFNQTTLGAGWLHASSGNETPGANSRMTFEQKTRCLSSRRARRTLVAAVSVFAMLLIFPPEGVAQSTLDGE